MTLLGTIALAWTVAAAPAAQQGAETTTSPAPAVAAPSPVAATPPAGAPATSDIERALLVKRLLQEVAGERSRPDLGLPSIEVMEQEVEALRQKADGMAGNGDETQEILVAAAPDASNLEVLGVNAGKAADIRELSREVQELQAHLSLVRLRAPSSNNPGAALVDVTEVPDVAAPAAAVGDSPAPEATPTRRRSELVSALRYPDRTVTLLYRMNDLARVVEVVERVGVDKIAAESRYAFAASLAAVGRRDDARAQFEALGAMEDRRTLALAASRQLERLAMLEQGVVELRPIERERRMLQAENQR